MKTLQNIASVLFCALFALALGDRYCPFIQEENKRSQVSQTTKPAHSKKILMQVQLVARANGLKKYHFWDFGLDIWAKDLATAMRKFTKEVQPISMEAVGQYRAWSNINFFEVEITA